ncbi:MAG: cyclopropane-fatty-acyl-phospholipid synthase family protein [Gammaproteobacteria bacterium]
MFSIYSDQKRLTAAKRILRHVAGVLELPLSVRLWDGSIVALGTNADRERFLSVDDAGVLGALLRHPSLETLYRLYASGHIDVHGADFMVFLEIVQKSRKQKGGQEVNRRLRQGFPWLSILPLLTAPEPGATLAHRYGGDETGYSKQKRRNKELIQFHYDVSNEFYALFLDAEMVYSCGYFTDWSNSLEQAQQDKLDLICRKLRLKPGDRFLDIGSGWGALLCHAARHYGVTAEGVTLSQRQYDYTVEKIARLGLQERVRVSLQDYLSLEGTYDKISSIGMYEHIGIANYPEYFRKVLSLLDDHGIFLNHGITRRGKINAKTAGRVSASRSVLLKYIFPGSELDDIGHTIQVMEGCGLEVHDVENLRPHYAKTCRLWYERLLSRSDAAIAQVGFERYRMWLVYIAAVARTFDLGAMRIYQTVATKRAMIAGNVLPQTRTDLYRDRQTFEYSQGTGTTGQVEYK